ncbi:FecR domain-containing protein [uncultured Sunxiuqinia sp.]|uniref:FecR family protein n=1 Tax=uncultured Sunxiuqinia sp. TaxID=1573825 RepID=UPI002AA8C842|nr:FecR domain-containing protein [uncultured Sunxiuqinia sp.]
MNETTTHEGLIACYLNGDYTAADEKALLEWIASSPENKKRFLEIKDTWDTSLRVEQRNTEQLLKFYQRQALQKRTRSFPAWLPGAVAAAVLLIGFFLGSVLQPGFFSQKAQVESYYVPQGSKSELVLADGTKVKMNAGSRLEISPDFSAKNRVIRLNGEAYFEVSSDPGHPFTVETEKFDVLVTGTKFNVSSYAEDQEISATLSEGKIKLTTASKQVLHLKPGDKVSFDQKTMQAKLEKADITSELAWVNGEFIFKDIPFPDLVKRLERWYDVKLNYQSTELEAMTYSGKFKNQETIWQVLDALKLTSPIGYKKTNFRAFELIYQPMK